MKKITLLMMFLSSLSFAQNPSVLSLWEPQIGGLNTKDPSHLLDKNDFKDMQDVYTDQGLCAEKREGLLKIYNSSASPQNLYEYINLQGNKYLIVKSSQYLGFVDTDNTYKVIMATLPATARLWKLQYMNNCYLGTNQITDRWLFDPTAASSKARLKISTYIPCGMYSLDAYDKGFMIAISTPLKNEAAITTNNDKSIVRYSAVGNLKSWAGVVDGDKWIGVSRADGEDLTGGFVFKGNVYVTKKHSVHQLINVDDDDTTNDGEIPVFTNIGCISQDSIQEVNGNMYWLSADGVVEWSGTSYKIISAPIADKIDTLSKHSIITSKSVSDTTQGDFNAGTKLATETTSYAGSVILSNKWNNQINQRQNIVDFTGAVVNSAVIRYQTFRSSYTLQLSTISVFAKKFTTPTAPLTIEIDNANKVLIASQTIQAVRVGSTSQWVPADFHNWNITLTAEVTYYITVRTTSTVVSGHYWSVSYSTGSTYARGQFEALLGSTVYTYPTWDMTFRVYQYHFNQGQWGSFTSQKRQISNWNQWSYLRANYGTTTAGKSGGNIQWYVSVATATAICGMGKYLVKVSTGFVIPSSQGGWCLWYASMTTTDIGVSPKLDDVTIEYLESATSAEEFVTSYGDLKNLRYGLSGTKSALSTHNDILYTYQIRNGKWTKFTIPARSFGRFNNEQYMGCSLGEGNINKFSSDYTTDNGSLIRPYVQTPDYLLATRANDCQFNELWAYADPSVIYSSMTVQCYLNKNSVAFSTNTMNISLTPGSYANMFVRLRAKRPIDRFRSISLKIENFERFYGLDFIFTPQSLGFR
jgi:hypothetical protein